MEEPLQCFDEVELKMLYWGMNIRRQNKKKKNTVLEGIKSYGEGVYLKN